MSTFYFDFNSPYAYLAAHRVDRMLAAPVRWQPIAFAFVIRALDRTPWSFTDARPAGMRECAERVPTVLVDGETFWGDDRLEAAAARLAA